MSRILFFLLLIFPFKSQAQNGFSGSFNVLTLRSSSSENGNSFWLYANQYGRIGKNTDYLGLGNVEYNYSINRTNDLELGAGALLSDGTADHLRVDQLYARYTHKNIRATFGLRHRDPKMMGLSSVGGDILWSGNARAVPGILLQLVSPVQLFKVVHFDASLGHYFLGDDRFVSGAQVHFKDFKFIVDLSPRDLFSLKLSHYAEYGGRSPISGEQPDGFSDYLKIFFGGDGGRMATASDQANALGNHIGSYELAYAMKRDGFDLKFYHQSLFEDTSGRELSNFPDGVWGAYFRPKKNRFIEAILYEYVQTVSQSGRFGSSPNGSFSGNDNYFHNSTYRSGWTYENRIIGLPFIIRAQDGLSTSINRFYVHHLGLAGRISKVALRLKTSYVKNLGTYTNPLPRVEHALYSFLEAGYSTRFGAFDLKLGADFSDQERDLFNVGIGYSISF